MEGPTIEAPGCVSPPCLLHSPKTGCVPGPPPGLICMRGPSPVTDWPEAWCQWGTSQSWARGHFGDSFLPRLPVASRPNGADAVCPRPPPPTPFHSSISRQAQVHQFWTDGDRELRVPANSGPWDSWSPAAVDGVAGSRLWSGPPGPLPGSLSELQG